MTTDCVLMSKVQDLSGNNLLCFLQIDTVVIIRKLNKIAISLNTNGFMLHSIEDKILQV